MINRKENLHEGHRKRMRDKFLSAKNFESFPEHNLLEMLLFYSSPRSDTNELSHSLIKHFGSLKDVLDAPYDALMTVKGVGIHTAILLKLIQHIVKNYNFYNSSNIKQVKCLTDAENYLMPIFCNKTSECIVMLCLNHSNRLLKTSVISTGSVDAADLDLRKLLFDALSCQATKIVLAHNHPGGVCAPSLADIEVTKAVAKVLNNMQISFVDHIIIAGKHDFFSFASNDLTSKHLYTEQSNTHIATDEDSASEDEYDWLN